jgi:hypothetical protein
LALSRRRVGASARRALCRRALCRRALSGWALPWSAVSRRALPTLTFFGQAWFLRRPLRLVLAASLIACAWLLECLTRISMFATRSPIAIAFDARAL